LRSFKIVVQGQTYQGAWKSDPERVEVRSDYGRRTAYLDGREPGDAARSLLAQMVPRAVRD
jgi:hypothetical protein